MGGNIQVGIGKAEGKRTEDRIQRTGFRRPRIKGRR